MFKFLSLKGPQTRNIYNAPVKLNLYIHTYVKILRKFGVYKKISLASFQFLLDFLKIVLVTSYKSNWTL